ncbi:MAG: isoprenoid biosynthesis glyoxalase ElbB [Phycisphaeraceae bacterium]|nr:MAG: isoprenoid biosynthesis glyoxalase ElbB [Phycisphaeraceae bacterium]
MLPIAVVLSGCGRGDGSEIHESVSCLIHLSRHGAPYRCFAPDKPQADVINHATGQPAPESRNVMVESARISRGEISPLQSLDPSKFSAVIFPGGFGAAKNLSTFARDGQNCSVDPDVQRTIKGFRSQSKPIGLCCIAPVLAAKVLGTNAGGTGCSVTIGSDEQTSNAIRAMGATNVPKPATEAVIDEANHIVTTPAYMCDASVHEVYTGIGKMVDAVVALANRS